MSGPAHVVQMPPQPETSKTYVTVECRECGIEEGIWRDNPTENASADRHADAHNRNRHAPAGTFEAPPSEDPRNEFGEILADVYDRGGQCWGEHANAGDVTAVFERVQASAWLAAHDREVAAKAVEQRIPTVEEFMAATMDEMARHPEKGYTVEHDRQHGADHLLSWATEYARRGEAVKSNSLIIAARRVLATPPPDPKEGDRG